MHVTVLLYGGLKAYAGTDRIEVDVAEGPCRVSDVVAAVAATRPSLAPALGGVAYVVSEEVVRSSHEVRPGDVLELLPPVSGGSR